MTTKQNDLFIIFLMCMMLGGVPMLGLVVPAMERYIPLLLIITIVVLLHRIMVKCRS